VHAAYGLLPDTEGAATEAAADEAVADEAAAAAATQAVEGAAMEAAAEVAVAAAAEVAAAAAVFGSQAFGSASSRRLSPRLNPPARDPATICRPFPLLAAKMKKGGPNRPFMRDAFSYRLISTFTPGPCMFVPMIVTIGFVHVEASCM
jgi:hypothetical protein